MKTKLAAFGAILAGTALAGCVMPSRLAPASAPVAVTAHVDASATGAPDAEARRAAALVEESWALLAAALGTSPRRVEVHVYGDRAAYAAAGGAGEGLYLPDERRIVTFVPVNPRVLRHELAHHFAVDLVGILPDWLNEGIAEYLETVREQDGRAVVPGVVPAHLAAILARDGVELFPTGRFQYRPVDYAHAWALVAWLIESGEGSLAARILALKRHAGTPPAELEKTRRAAWTLPPAWAAELERELSAGTPGDRLAAARALGRLGRDAALRAALPRESRNRIRVVIAAELARLGDKAPLRSLVAGGGCQHLDEVSRSAGRGFATSAELEAWLEVD